MPPNWRDYLYFGTAAVGDEPVFGNLRPKNDVEREIWRDYIAKGWNQGVDQANVMLQYGLDRLNRDLTGMISTPVRAPEQNHHARNCIASLGIFGAKRRGHRR